MLKKFLVCCFALFSLSAARADLIITDQLDELFDDAGNGTGNSVDHIYFTVNSGGSISFNMLSYDAFSNYFDTYIYLFSDDGDIGADDLLAQNDDSGDAGNFSDGSTTTLDSFLTMLLSPGSYMLAIDSCCHAYELENIIDGFNTHGAGHMVGPDNYGSYQLTITGDVSLTHDVPAPAALALMALGLFGVRSLRRKQLIG